MEEIPAKRRKLAHAAEENTAIPSAGLPGSAFVLQTRELLHEERLNYDNNLEGVGPLLHKVKASIEDLDTHGPLPILEASSKLSKIHRVQVPFPEPTPPRDSNYKVSLEKPTLFNVVGSYISRTMSKSQKDHAVDMIVVMPETMLQAKDYLDMRYFYKRAYFLAAIACRLEHEFDSAADPRFEWLHDNPLLPVFSLAPLAPKEVEGRNGPSRISYRIRIIPCAPDGLFPVQKLLSATSLVRGGKGMSEADNTFRDHAQPTPFYNSTLKAEGCFLAYLRLLQKAEKHCQAFRDACILGRIWLQQRGLGGKLSEGGFGPFEFAVLLALLLQGGGNKKQASLSSSLTSTQLFKALVQFISVTNFANKPYILGAEKPNQEATCEDGPVLYDSSRHLNLAFKMSPSSAAMLQQQARWTHSLLSNSDDDHFVPTFITKCNIPLQVFDLAVRIKCSPATKGNTDYRGRVWEFASQIYKVLKRALGDRARLIHLSTPPLENWPTFQPVAPESSSMVEVGILFDPTNMSRQVDHGPPSEDKVEAKEFRQFWGEKAELRRFADGSILETLIWTGKAPGDLCEEITRYSLRLHLQLGLLEDDLLFYGNKFSSLLPLNPTDAASFNAARKAFNSFERDVRDLEELPLHIRQLAPISPELRYASVKPPLNTTKSGPRPMEVVLSFEVSGKWPENLAAVQRTKVAFLLKIGSLLEQSKSEVKTYLGLESAMSDTENLAFLDVIYESGPSFRIRIHCDLEESLLEQKTKDKTLDERVRADGATLLATFKRLYIHLPLLSQTVATFVTRFPALSPTIRLLKHWFSAHKLICHFNEELLELITLHTFLKCPTSAPSSINAGFLQALLFLSQWDWRTDPLVVDTSGEMLPADFASVRTRLEAWRKLDPNMNRVVLIAATSHDLTSGIAYTTLEGQAKPSKVVATRMTTLARSASRLVKEVGISLEPRLLFTPSLKDYDILIHLSEKETKRSLRMYEMIRTDGEDGSRHSRFKNLDERTGLDPLPLAQHPTDAFLNQLNAIYSGALLFFCGGPEDSIISGLWNPQMQARAFKPNLSACYKPSRETDHVKLNKSAIIAEIARIGGALVERIDIREQ